MRLMNSLPLKRKSAVLAIAFLIASGAAATLFAQTVTYPVALEGQLWKQLLPWGLNKDENNQTIWADRLDLNNTPSPLREYRGWVDPLYGDVLYGSVRIDDPRWEGRPDAYGRTTSDALLAAQLQFEQLTDVGQCTFSHADDYDIGWWVYFPQVRYCKGPNGEKLPPAPGKLLNPASIALSKNKVYVSDLFNHRIQVFDFYGRALPVQFPIGNGVPGTGRYNYDITYPSLNYRPYPNFNGGFSGHQLNAPYGIALDSLKDVNGVATPRLLIADSGNDRVAIFNENGSPAFGTDAAPIHVALPTPVSAFAVGSVPAGTPLSGEIFKPDLIAVSPNAVVLAPGTVIGPNDPNRNERIVITDRVHCYIQIVDPAFNPIKSMPLVNPVPSQHHGCKDGLEGTVDTQPYEFSTVTGVQIDASGNIYIADHAQNTVQVFDRNGVFISFIGKPGQNNPGGAGNLRGPVGLLIDDLGRLGVIDAGNARVVFYDLTNGPAQTAFAFQIGITLAVEDFPMGLAFQVGPATDASGAPTGLDPKGRILVTDPLRRRMLRFELPEIVIANATATITRPDLTPKEGVASFDVVVPWQKRSPVNGVIVTIEPQNPGSVSIKNGSISPSLSSRPNIANGQLLHYTFEFTSKIAEAKFDITARGECDKRGQNCLAKQVEAPAIARALCTGCIATHAVYVDPETPPAPVEALPIDTDDQVIEGRTVSGWYDREVFVRIQPVIPEGTPLTDPKRIVSIEWSYGGITGLIAGTFTNVLDTTNEFAFVDVPVRASGVSWVTYRAITVEGSASAPVEVLLPIDLSPPSILFTNWTPRTGTDGQRDWHNQAVVTGTYQVIDTESGPGVPVIGTVTFTAEAADQVGSFTVTDQVGHSVVRNSLDATAGRSIHIDRHAPVFYDDGELTFFADMTGVSNLRRYATLPQGAFRIDAADPNLPTGQPGSRAGDGRFQVSSPAGQYFDGDTITFTAADNAGNSSTKTATIRIRGIVPTLTVTGVTVTYDGLTHPATCVVSGVPGATGVGVLTYSPGGTSLPQNAGTYSATCSFAGDDFYLAALPVTTTVQINPKSATLTAGSNTKVFRSGADPAIGYSHSGIIAADVPTITFTTSRVAGENVGSYATSVTATGGNAGNYIFSMQAGAFTITPATVIATPNSDTKVYGNPNPLFTPTFSGFPTGYSTANIVGTVTCGVAVANPGVGSHTVTCSGGSIDANVLLTYGTSQLTVTPRPATVAANPASRQYGDPNPSFSAVLGGLAPGETTLNFTLAAPTATLTAPVGGYPINVTLLSNPNYTITPTNSTLTITPRLVAVQADFKTKEYGSSDPTLTATVVGGLVGSDQATGSLLRAPGSDVGLYAISQGSYALGGNYAITGFTGNNLQITPKTASITANDNSKIVGQPDPVPLTTFSTSGFLPADALTFSVSRQTGPAYEAIGDYVITPSVSGAKKSNYNISYNAGVFHILTDNQKPVCSTAYGGEIWPPNHKKFYAAPINGVTDPEGQKVTIKVTGIWQDEEIDSTGDGQFSPDGQGVGTDTAWVRAERNGEQNEASGDGRVYEILFTATDPKGAFCTGSVFWTVPHDQGQRSTAVDSIVRYDSTGAIAGARDKWQIHQKSPQP